jgi:hypothetical protein
MQNNNASSESAKEHCKWRSAKGLWFPFLIMLMIISSAASRIVSPSPNIIFDYLSIIIAWGVVAGMLEMIITRGRNVGLMLSFAFCGLFSLILEQGIFMVAIVAVGVLPVAYILIKIEKYTCPGTA